MEKTTLHAGYALQEGDGPFVQPQQATGADQPLRGPVIAISPHYDDAVFSCGQLLAEYPGSTVVTVFTDIPEHDLALTSWDEQCGFTSARQAMHARAIENKAALAMLKAQDIDLHFLDDQYPDATQNGANLLSDTLASTISSEKAASVIFPLGLFHRDHIRVSDAIFDLLPQFPSISWIAYEDIPYRSQVLRCRERLRALSRTCVLTPFRPALPRWRTAEHKQRAVIAYGSQLQGLGYDGADPIMAHTETYWRVHCEMALM